MRPKKINPEEYVNELEDINISSSLTNFKDKLKQKIERVQKEQFKKVKPKQKIDAQQ